ncbi:serine/threonine-protein kinase [Chondromyces apiculatus]|nr:serine/threonine-protein kinase [Chondromyces apiculatus]
MGVKQDTQLGPYRLLHPLGAGGMGQVFAATDTRTDQVVALKLLQDEAAQHPQLVARFLQEGRALSMLRHPGIVKVLDCVKPEDGRPFVVMEVLQSPTLRDWVAQQDHPLELETVISLGQQIAEAMSHVHEQGIVHRDLKPSNILVTTADGTAPSACTIKVVDFGIAKVPAAPEGGPDTQVQTGDLTVLGTARYMAPEQFLGAAEVTAKADVYALGVVLFELISGRLPFLGDEDAEFMAKHAQERAPSLRALRPEVPAGLCVLVDAMLAKEPGARPTMQRCRAAFAEPWRTDRAACPFPGLQPFTEAQAELFFGRRAQIDQISERLDAARESGRGWVQIEGPSGAGKSSLVQAGLRPRLLEARGAQKSPWRIACMSPSTDPLRSLAQALVDTLAEDGSARDLEEVAGALRADPDALRALLAGLPPGCTLLLVIEQMEELFTLGAAHAPLLDALLSAALVGERSRLCLLTTLRSDFLSSLEQMPKLARILNQASRHHLLPLDEEGLREVTLGMAQRAGLALSEKLAGRMVRDAASAGCQLLLLGHTLRMLWSASGATSEDLAQRYEQLGGVGGALARHAEKLLDALGPEGRERAKWILLELVQVKHGAPAARRTRTRKEVLDATGGDPRAEEVLLRLSGMRPGTSPEATGELRLLALSSDPDEDPSTQRVSLIHEALLSQVPVIADWLKEARSRLQRVTDVEAAAEDWQRRSFDADYLARGTKLAHYRDDPGEGSAHAPRKDPLNPLAQRFMKESEAREEQRRILKEAREERRRILKEALVISVILVAALIALSAVHAFGQQRIADENARHAEHNLARLVGAAEQISDIDWKLGRVPGILGRRRKLLTSIDEALKSLPAEDHRKAEVSARTVTTKHRLGDLALHNDALATADRHYADARVELQRSQGLTTDEGPWRLSLALNESKRGKVALARNRLDEAQRHFTEALIILRTLERSTARGGQDTDDIHRTVAVSYTEQAELALAQGDPEEAAWCFEEALARLGLLTRDEYNQSLLAQTLVGRASVALSVDDLDVARACLDEALQLQEPLARSASSDTYTHSILASIHAEIALLWLKQGDLHLASLHGAQAHALSRKLHQGDPERKAYALILGKSLQRLEAVAAAQGDTAKAAEARTARHALVAPFLRLDGEDVRFQRLASPDPSLF